jgi:heme ABC exporter ATP-binding subunit CcmA
VTIAHLDNAVVTLAGYPLLSGVDLDIEERSVVVLTGPNGAGKTSLLRLLAGLEALARGEGRVLGFDLVHGDRRQLRREVGWIGHEGSFYNELTVRDNLVFAARALGRPIEDIPGALQRTGLAERTNTLAKRLSAGQRRRLGLAWLLLRRPSLWILDEPYASLDENGREFLNGLIADVTSQGATVVLSAHDPLRNATFDVRQVRMEGGRIVNSDVQ